MRSRSLPTLGAYSGQSHSKKILYASQANSESLSDNNDNDNETNDNNSIIEKLKLNDNNSNNLFEQMKYNWKNSCEDLKKKPLSYIMIPIVAACVGYITNYVGVKMLFYPVEWTGISILRFPQEPFGWLGWQGIVPAKRYRMAEKMVDVTITKLLDVGEIFRRLDPKRIAKIIEPDVRSKVLGGFSLPFINRFFLNKSCKEVVNRASEVVNIRQLVVSGLATNPTTLSDFFQNVGRKELRFLVNSGFGVGFVLGLFQMVQWMVYPKGWTLPAGGAVVGYITNWIALKWIFEPLDPTRVGPFILQGMFLKRQNEVAEDFSRYIAKNTLCSKRVWADILNGESTSHFTKMVASKLPLPIGQVKDIVSHLRTSIGNGMSHPLHDYSDAVLKLRQTLEFKMKMMSSREFEQVLHPIFKEDEFTLILAGALLGAAAGGIQWWQNDKIDDWVNKLSTSFSAWRAQKRQKVNDNIKDFKKNIEDIGRSSNDNNDNNDNDDVASHSPALNI